MKKSNLCWIVITLMLVGAFFFKDNEPLVEISGLNGVNFDFDFLDFSRTISSGKKDEKLLEEPQIESIFLEQPKPCVVREGEILSFGVSLAGDFPYTAYWQYSPLGGNDWFDSAADTAQDQVLWYLAKEEYDGRRYRCIVVNDWTGEIYTSQSATLTVLPK